MANALMEIVKLFLGQTTRKLLDVLQTRWSNARSKEAFRAEQVVQLLRWSFAVRFSSLSFLPARVQQLPHIYSELLVCLVVVHRLPAQPVAWFSKRHIRDLAAVHYMHLLRALQASNLQSLLLLNDLMHMVAVEDFRNITAYMFHQNELTTWMKLGELGDVINIAIDRYPRVSGFVVLLQLIHGDHPGGCCRGCRLHCRS
mmetsp:Transcript_12882/g.29154  ORF Transcript_12882/g.29154 Transcript_12882/m.29154 type:complete len:200 (+) Transcript_12882:1053-1652(+)